MLYGVFMRLYVIIYLRITLHKINSVYIFITLCKLYYYNNVCIIVLLYYTVLQYPSRQMIVIA